MRATLPRMVLLAALGLAAPADADAKIIRVACVGTSITYGAGVIRRELNCYPAQLGAMLGGAYDVGNFGKNGATALQRGDLPYARQAECRGALDYLPDVVLIELGTNDTKPQNRVHLAEFEQDYLGLVRSFRRLPSSPRIVLLLPPPVFSHDTTGITNAFIRDAVIPMIRSVAHASSCEVINLYNYLLDARDSFSDEVHPSSVGAGLIAARLYEAVTQDTAGGFDLPDNLHVAGPASNYYGFDCRDFSFEGRSAKIVRPWRVAKGRPWLWRARFWGHEPQAEIALLERGFHLVYCDVAELFGNDEAVGIWDRFYEVLVRGGLSRRPALEGFSRAGVYMYRWAARNPDRVACVYADAPVLDMKSWPGGRGRSRGNPVEWERFKADFGLGTEEEALAFSGNPLDLAERIARAGFPMLHVCGDADDVVPIEENTDQFEKKVLAAGGRITVIRKPGIGHHPHSLPNPQPIVDFILRATGQKINFARIPAPGNEYRGWTGGREWHALAGELDRLCADRPGADVLLFGDSIVEGIGGEGRTVSDPRGDSAVAAALRGRTWVNLGIPGDRTQNVLWRVLHGNWQRLKPRLVVLVVGVNNFDTDSGGEVAEGLGAIVGAIGTKDPRARVLVVGPLPPGDRGSPVRRRFEETHRALRSCGDGERVIYTDLAFAMLGPDGRLQEGLFASDGIHLTRDGYGVFARLLARDIHALKRSGF